jgi:Uma2 family endonuclease
MHIRAKLAPEQQLTIDEFLAFTAARPGGERWELIEGVAVLNPSPVAIHQLVAANIVSFLLVQKRESGATWIPLLGVGTHVPAAPKSLPQPDVYVQDGPVRDSPVTGDAIVIFEVLSMSNTKADQAWRRRVYASVPNCEHYVTVSLKSAEVTLFSRDNSWRTETSKGLSHAVAFSALGVSMPLAEIYRDTPLAAAKPKRKSRR